MNSDERPPAPTPEPERVPSLDELRRGVTSDADRDLLAAPLPDTGDGRPPLDWVCRRSVGSCTADAPHAGSMCGPEDVPSLDELRRGVTSEATCDRCGRQTWTEREVMRFCRMTQPSGDECAGTLRPAAPPAPTPEPEPAPAPPAVPGDRPDPLADLVPLAEDVLDAATDRSGFRNGRLLADAVIDADAQPAHPAPDGDELRNLRRWKSEATTVLDTWDKVHEALGSPGLLGEHKSAASLAEIERRTAAMRQLIDDIAPPGGYGVADGTGES